MEFVDVASHHEELPSAIDILDGQIQHLINIKQVVDCKLDKLIGVRRQYVEGDLSPPELANLLNQK